MSLTHLAPASHATTCDLILIRHAETVDNLSGRMSGWTDSDLTPRGEEQARLLAEHVARAHPEAAAMYASPLTRARRTALAIGAATGLAPIFVDDLREMFFGEIEGLRFEEIKAAYAHLLKADEDADQDDFAWPGGESRLDFAERVRSAMGAIAATHRGRQVVVVTHGGVISTFLAILHGESLARWRKWNVSNASVSEVRWDPVSETGVLARHGDARHLEELTEEETVQPG